ncbi:hypothetical protein AB0J72_18095 [Dactylosporangium sp. NPDC049742]|uniref:hypothetical protein n=1 Tax=Dactylosporangium sp. NPDC049742 TaxID=3154737 RepID=UPI0034368901
MRTKAITAIVAAALLLSACTSSPERKSGDAAPAGATTASPATSAATASPTATSAAPSTPAATKTSATTTLVLGPQGYGALRLGMTREQAVATGLLTPFEDAGCPQAFIKGRPAGQGRVFLSPERGISAIWGWPTLSTAEGLRAGMSVTDARGLYPNWTVGDGTFAEGRHYAKVPGNEKAVFRIGTSDNKVDSVTLQLANQNCYE